MNLDEARKSLRITVGKASVEDLPNETADYYINEANRYISGKIIRAVASNNGSFNEQCATTDIIKGQSEYTLTTPIPLKNIKRIQIKPTPTSEYVIVSPTDLYNLGVINIDGSSYGGIRLNGNCLFLLNIPKEDVEQGILIWYCAEATDLCERYNAGVEEALGKKLEIYNIPNFTGKLKLSQNSSDDLVVELSNNALEIKLANTSPEKNSLIELTDKITDIFQDAEIKVENWFNITGSVITVSQCDFALYAYDETLYQAEGDACVIDRAAIRYCSNNGMIQKRNMLKEQYVDELEEALQCYTNLDNTKPRKFRLRRIENYR